MPAPISFYESLIVNGDVKNMPSITVSKRDSDKFIVYNNRKMRLDRIAADFYDDDSLWRIILWANPQYFLEFDIPNETVIRVPFPKRAAIQEVLGQIIRNRDV